MSRRRRAKRDSRTPRTAAERERDRERERKKQNEKQKGEEKERERKRKRKRKRERERKRKRNRKRKRKRKRKRNRKREEKGSRWSRLPAWQCSPKSQPSEGLLLMLRRRMLEGWTWAKRHRNAALWSSAVTLRTLGSGSHPLCWHGNLHRVVENYGSSRIYNLYAVSFNYTSHHVSHQRCFGAFGSFGAQASAQ